LLDRYGFDAAQFESLRDRMVRGELSADQNRIRDTVEPPRETDVPRLPPLGSKERERLAAIGSEAMRKGEVGCVVLAGGMATRFGGVVKAAVDALPGQSFLHLKLRGIRLAAEQARARVPVYVMTSFATDAQIRELLEAEQSAAAPATAFAQLISLRLRPDGELLQDNGAPSPYAPGHGDLTFALRQRGVLSSFLAGGGRVLYMSNVDNLAATLDPAVIGAHLTGGAAVTAEVVSKDPGDAGGAPARVAGVLQIVESFRFPKEFSEDRIPVFNVNSFALDARAIDRDFPLTWFVVKKKVAGQEAIQFEHLVGELTAFLPSACLHVDREGNDGRFQPVKDPEELVRRAPRIEAMLRARGVL
ncbi:MAG TPA: UTP--glucose-1-phosphate uridylyltransferase, partial [Polyangiales bacterium]|nr:UTP--glucose-1-phosphate uridylyltransferase [Polyangiales bacterium]